MWLFRKRLKRFLGQSQRQDKRENKILKFCFLLLTLSPITTVTSACSSKEYVPTPQVIKVAVPEFLTKTTPEPHQEVMTNANLVELVLEYQEALRRCNEDKKKIGEL